MGMFYGHNQPKAMNAFGLLYNGNWAVNQFAAPAGWHVPTKADWDALNTYLTLSSRAHTHLKYPGKKYWNQPILAVNYYWFNAIGSGQRIRPQGGSDAIETFFTGLYDGAYFWTKSEVDVGANKEGNIASIAIYHDLPDREVLGGHFGSGLVYQPYGNRTYGRAIRLIKDDSNDPGNLTDWDGNDYLTCTIGSQVWLASNWRCKSIHNGIQKVTIPEADDAAWDTAPVGEIHWCYYDNDPRRM